LLIGQQDLLDDTQAQGFVAGLVFDQARGQTQVTWLASETRSTPV